MQVTAKMIADTNFDVFAKAAAIETPARAPRFFVQHSNTFQDTEGNYLDEYVFLWGETFAFRDWFSLTSPPMAPPVAGGGARTSRRRTRTPTTSSARRGRSTRRARTTSPT